MYLSVYLTLLIAFFHSGFADQYYIYPSDIDQCPDIVCRNLSDVAANSNDEYFSDNSVVNFIEGTHRITGSKMIEIIGKTNLVLQGPPDDGSIALIECDHNGGGFAFFNVFNLSIKSIKFRGCGKVLVSSFMSETILNYTKTKYVNRVYLQSFHCILFANVTDLSIEKLTIHNTTGRAMSLLNAFNVLLSDVELSYNNIQSWDNPYCSRYNCIGGNLYFLYLDDASCWHGDNTIFNLTVKNSVISRGVNLFGYPSSGGLGVGIYHTLGYGMNIVIDNVTLDGNTAVYGANVYILIPEDFLYYSLTFTQVVSINGNAIYPIHSSQLLDATQGAGMLINAGTFFASFIVCDNGGRVGNFTENTQIVIENALISGNIAKKGAGLAIGGKSCLQGCSCSMRIENTTIFNNRGLVGTGMFLQQFTSITSRVQLSGLLRNVQVYDNDVRSLVPTASDESSSKSCAVSILNFQYLTFSGVSVMNHGNTGVYLYMSNIAIEDQNTTIDNNINNDGNGGGMVFAFRSHVTLIPPGNLILTNNHAQLGGAISVSAAISEEISPKCFFQIHSVDSYSQNVIPPTHIYAFNNTASIGGDILYTTDGGLFNCAFTSFSYYYGRTGLTLLNDFMNLVLVTDRSNESSVSTSALKSSSVKVCACEESGKVNCTIIEITQEFIPGHVFYLMVATVDFLGNISPGVIRATYNGSRATEESIVTSHDLVYTVTDECIQTPHLVTYDMFTTSQLTVVDSTNEDLNVPITINFNLLDCPPGFSLDESTGICDCNDYIKQSQLNITCSANDWTITREGNNWINYENCTQIYIGCPFDYCTSETVTFNITEPYPQCQLDRMGTLCGQCKDGYSLLLGSNECSKCTSNFLVFILIPIFCVAGLLLVVAFIALNLTVAEGTINGVIFYANIVKISEPVFFQRKTFPVLTQFIAWLNLDLGIPTCFYNGFDEYTKTWLQFVFPVYIWCIIIIIVYLARRFRKFSRLVGENPVAVLATLLLLSYTKILRTVIQAMQRGVIHCDNGTQTSVWLLDGSIKYFSYEHGALFLFSFIVLLVICIPFTAFHLFIPLLERYVFNRRRFSKVYVIIRPYLDAVGGPYKDEYRFWPGLFLLIRLALASIIPFVDSTYDNMAITIAIVLILVLGWNLHGVYRKWYNDVIESWFLLNLGLLCVMSFSQVPISGAIVLLSLALVSFLAIIIFHIAKRIYKKKKKSNKSSLLAAENDHDRKSMAQGAITRITRLGSVFQRPQTHTRRESREMLQNLQSYSVKCKRESLLSDLKYI